MNTHGAKKHCGGRLAHHAREYQFHQAIYDAIISDLHGKSRVRKWARLIIERDDKRCQVCGAEDKIHAHHIFDRKKYPSLRYRLDNGITLCPKCHGQWHSVKRHQAKEAKEQATVTRLLTQ